MPRRPLLNVVGALTDSLEIADSLFRVGCPLWLARPLGAEQGVKVLKWLDDIPDNELPRRNMDVEVSYDQATPPHEIIYKGGAARLEKYRQMAYFIRKLLSPPSIFNAPVEAVASPTETTEPGQSVAGPSRTHTRRGDHRMVPYSAPKQMSMAKGKNAKPPNRAASSDRDKFVDIVSDRMPRSLEAWATASKDIGPSVDTSKPARFGLMKGYAVPDPNMIAGFGRDPMAYAFTTYLKLRDVIIYRTTSGSFRPLATSSWRQMLGLELHGKKEGGHHAQKRSQLREELTNCIKGAKLENSLDVANLQAASVTWRGQVLVPFELPSVPICREILWELSEINFRVELVLLDSCCYEYREEGFNVRDDREEGEVDYDDLDASNSADRQLKVLAAFDFPAGFVPLSAKEAGDGLASPSWRTRRWALSALSRIMRGWRKAVPSMSTTLLELAKKLNDPSTTTEEVVITAERMLATYYIESFTSIFYRAPVLPHGL